MSVDGARDINSFFSSRVGFGEPPPSTSTTSSLLTFADMVLALDRQNIGANFELQSSIVEVSTESDHTYASNAFTRITRSQTAKVVAHLSSRFSESQEKLKIQVENVDDVTKDLTHNVVLSSQNDPHHLKIKRCSSVEKMCSGDTAERVCEWPEVASKHSPKKSSSFEEVNGTNRQLCMKSSKSSEHVQRTGVSHTLHRVINNTLEFPCWPRKADHTYATATWDGTATSHSLFEQELHQDTAKQHIIEDQEMEDTDHEYTVQNRCEHLCTTTEHQSSNFAGVSQKDDHTYVKSKVPDFNPPSSVDIEPFSLVTEVDANRTHVFSSATFPRQKMREDHTYFHSGFSKKNISGVVKREWASTQTVAAASTDQELTQDIQVEEAYRNLNSSSQSASAKKDHNYSTST